MLFKSITEKVLNRLLKSFEHSVSHCPQNTSKMDPFGVKLTAMPYILSLCFDS